MLRAWYFGLKTGKRQPLLGLPGQVIVFVFFVVALACNRPQTSQQVPSAGTSAPPSLFSHAVIKNGKTYDYEVLFDGKPIVKQTTIPVPRMKKGFSDSVSADRVAALVERRLADGLPPAISKKEMDSLGIALP